ncbi:MAG: hypothetical protein OXC65_05935 [Thiotrichales bacterium]|nr:hypothetical protein [Thiotrichales bacterium]
MHSDTPSLNTHVITELTQAARTCVRGLEPLAAAEQHRLDATHTPMSSEPQTRNLLVWLYGFALVALPVSIIFVAAIVL